MHHSFDRVLTQDILQSQGGASYPKTASKKHKDKTYRMIFSHQRNPHVATNKGRKSKLINTLETWTSHVVSFSELPVRVSVPETNPREKPFKNRRDCVGSQFSLGWVSSIVFRQSKKHDRSILGEGHPEESCPPTSSSQEAKGR